ncbi:hypothetical protein [Nocardioides bizhenqiangii]|uniref:YggT family protein n=1 Tax=Nocardioides bizhenqiangii TaxID=3095076 RepID=A0ABZ0ZVZ3_9ACTN|nr:hypothetical protein [Nocardioides sp. HM61]WQQ28004.1 hypothetical protein SHK19_07165 [Nocardioides sp. HM61]
MFSCPSAPSLDTLTAPVGHERHAVLWGARALAYLLYVYVILTETVLVLGFVLLLLGANPDPPFVQWAYRSLDRAMEPFRGILTSIELGDGGNQVEAVLDTSVLFATVVYGFAAWLIHTLIVWLSRRTEGFDRLDRPA